MTPSEAAAIFTQTALGMITDGIHDPLPELSAAIALLRIETGEIPDDDLQDLLEWAEELTE